MAIKYITRDEYQELTGRQYEGPSEGGAPAEEEAPAIPESEERGFLASILNPVRFAAKQFAAAGRTAMGDEDPLRPVKFPGILGGGEETPLSGQNFGDLVKGAGAGLEAASWAVGGGEAKALLKGAEHLAPSVMRTLSKEGVGAGLKAYGKKALQLSPISLMYEGGQGLQGEKTPEDALTSAFTGVLTMPVFAGLFERGAKALGSGLKTVAGKLSTDVVPPGGGGGVDEVTAVKKNIDSLYSIFRKKPFLNQMETMAGVSPESNFAHSIGQYSPKIKSDNGFARTADAVKEVNNDIASLYGTKEKPGEYVNYIKNSEPVSPETLPKSQDEFLNKIIDDVHGEYSTIADINKLVVDTDVRKLWNDRFLPMLMDQYGYKVGKPFNLEQIDAIRNQAGRIAYPEEGTEVVNQAAQVIGKAAKKMLVEQAPVLADVLKNQESLLQTRSILKMLNGEQIGKSHLEDITKKGIFYTLLRTGPAGWALAAPAEMVAAKVAERTGMRRLGALTGSNLSEQSAQMLAREAAIRRNPAVMNSLKIAAEKTGQAEDDLIKKLNESISEIIGGVMPSQTKLGQEIAGHINTGAEKSALSAKSAANVEQKLMGLTSTIKQWAKNGPEIVTEGLINMGVPEELATKYASSMSKATTPKALEEQIKLLTGEMKTMAPTTPKPAVVPKQASEVPSSDILPTE